MLEPAHAQQLDIAGRFASVNAKRVMCLGPAGKLAVPPAAYPPPR
jgi:hypothetical protein